MINHIPQPDPRFSQDDVRALRAMGVSTESAERRRPDDLACLLKEKLDGMTFTYERALGRALDERNMWRGRCETTWVLLVAGVIWYVIGKANGWV